MSHFGTLVFIPMRASLVVSGATAGDGIRDYAQYRVEQLLAPYSEQLVVPERDEPCYCIGSAARKTVRDQVDEQLGTVSQLREEFLQLRAAAPAPSDDDIQKLWSARIDVREALEKKLLAEHPQAKAPDTDCDECSGSGVRQTTYNPKSKWDWWVIGGRWTGALTNYDPEKDPKNQERCPFCEGTGLRNDAVGLQIRAQNPSYTCNGCNGVGTHVKWSLGEYEGDTQPVSQLDPEHVCTKFYAALTPDGEWHERGEMGWFGMSNDKISAEDWQQHLKELLLKYPNHWAVVVDCHI